MIDVTCKKLLEHLIDKKLIINYDFITSYLHDNDGNKTEYYQLHIEYYSTVKIELVSLKIDSSNYVYYSISNFDIPNNYLIEYLLDLYLELENFFKY